ncbi:hypothetical protein B296_00034886 [Ensete ventricosum]|uniref:Uncharacterized protein n=1 Tax=Ensete ventricosum TaxID=4639 RepID=A0A427A7B1_ENSVE|nr:hypothetical protein B296_00034886 [Ensete ventricosum]
MKGTNCCSSSDKPRGRLLGPLRCRLAPAAGDDGRESLLRPSDDRQDPIGRALITSSIHSRAARQRNKAFRIGESVETARNYGRSCSFPTRPNHPEMFQGCRHLRRSWVHDGGIDTLTMLSRGDSVSLGSPCIPVIAMGTCRRPVWLLGMWRSDGDPIHQSWIILDDSISFIT